MSIFITSDTHFCHDKDFVYKPRGFTSVQEMNDAIITSWNDTIAPDDIVYHLGDVMLDDENKGMECVKALNGNIILILGNHDTQRRVNAIYSTLSNITILGHAAVIKYNKYNFYLSHYPTITTNFDDFKSPHKSIFNLFGHTHQTTNFYQDNKYMYHVGMDSHNCTPISLDNVIQDIKNKL